MADIKKLQDVNTILEYPDTDDPTKGTSEQDFQSWLMNNHRVVEALVTMCLWQPGSSYEMGQIIHSPNMLPNTCARVTTAGTTGNAEPVWSAPGSTVGDGTVTYLMRPIDVEFASQEEVTEGVDATKIVSPAMLGKTIQVDLGSENSVNLNDGTKEVTPGITGILPLEHGGTGSDTGIVPEAEKAQKLSKAITINGKPFDGTEDVNITASEVYAGSTNGSTVGASSPSMSMSVNKLNVNLSIGGLVTTSPAFGRNTGNLSVGQILATLIANCHRHATKTVSGGGTVNCSFAYNCNCDCGDDGA